MLEYRQERCRLPAVGRLQGFSNSPSRPDFFLFLFFIPSLLWFFPGDFSRDFIPGFFP
jgi:hypothetical protein